MKSKSERQQSQADAARRSFLGAGVILASGMILTPLALAGCGGDNSGDGRKPPKTGKKPGTKPAPTDDGSSTDGTTEPGAYTVVAAGELASKQNVKISLSYKGPHVEWTDPSLKDTNLPPGDDSARAKGEVEVDKFYPQANPLGTKYVVVEKVLTIKDGDRIGLCNCIIVLDPKGPEKVAKNSRDKVEVHNQYFRFEPRVHDVAVKGQVTWVNGDPVNHAISSSGLTPSGNGPTVSNGGTVAPNSKINTEGLGFIREGYYGVSCSLHGWELGRVMVTRHAYVGVSSKDNKCVVGLENVADGKYELQVWHESSNTPIKSMPIEVKSGAVDFAVELSKIG